MIYLTSLHFFKVSDWKCLYYAICKKTKMSTLRYLLQKLKNKAGHSKRKGITIVGLLIMMLSKSLGFQKIKLLYHSSLYPPTTYHVRIFFGQSIFFLCRISQFSQEITLRQIINSLLSPLTNRYCCKVKRKIGL